ncbi:hypothetical protein FRC18_006728 [Serendipita sp. 400]|nr:hypothetical protein FRC18_006728 [Serendipita sp. 400]
MIIESETYGPCSGYLGVPLPRRGLTDETGPFAPYAFPVENPEGKGRRMIWILIGSSTVRQCERGSEGGGEHMSRHRSPILFLQPISFLSFSPFVFTSAVEAVDYTSWCMFGWMGNASVLDP